MNRKEMKELKSCSKEGLIKLINDPRYVQNKAMQFPAIVGYLARHGMVGGTSKGEFLELVYAARNELLAQAAEQHVHAKDPIAYDDLGGNLSGPMDTRVKEFIRNPIGAMEREMETLHNRKEHAHPDQDPDETAYINQLKVNADILRMQLTVFREDRVRYNDKMDLYDVTSRLGKKMPEGDKDLDASMKRINSGFFGTLFRRPSKEFKEFQESFKMFRDVSRAHSGNTQDLEKKTTAYLKHAIPNFKYSKGMNKEELLAGLSKGQKARAGFCMDVLDSIQEHKEIKPYMENVERAVNGQKIKPIEQQQPEPVNEIQQKTFQNAIEKELEEPEVKEVKVVEAKEEAPQIEQNDLAA